MPELHNETKTRVLALLFSYFGASAPWVLTQAERRASSLADLPDLLVNALPNAQRRQEFLAEFSWLKQEDVTSMNAQSVSSVPTEPLQSDTLLEASMPNTAAPLTRLSISLAERRLAQFIGDTAVGIAQSLTPAPQTLWELYERLSLKISNDDHKKHFLSLCPGRNANA